MLGKVLTLCRRLSAVLLTFALAAGQAGVCAGWARTPEARLACCADDGACPMHRSGSEHQGATRAFTQAEADRCCAASEQDNSAPLPIDAAFMSTNGAALPSVPALLPEPDARTDIWRASVAMPIAHVPKHLLLSVFLL